MTHTTREKPLWAGYSFAQEQAFKAERERLTRYIQSKRSDTPAPVPMYERSG